MSILEQLQSTIESRKGAETSTSYSALLLAKGIDGISKKVIEEATECILAAKEEGKEHLIAEVADLWFHSLLLLAAKGCTVTQVLQELERREGKSGLVEKAERGTKHE